MKIGCRPNPIRCAMASASSTVPNVTTVGRAFPRGCITLEENEKRREKTDANELTRKVGVWLRFTGRKSGFDLEAGRNLMWVLDLQETGRSELGGFWSPLD